MLLRAALRLFYSRSSKLSPSSSTTTTTCRIIFKFSSRFQQKQHFSLTICQHFVDNNAMLAYFTKLEKEHHDLINTLNQPQQQPELTNSNNNIGDRLSYLSELIKLKHNWQEILHSLKELETMQQESANDAELAKMAHQDYICFQEKLEQIEGEIADYLLNSGDVVDDDNSSKSAADQQQPIVINIFDASGGTFMVAELANLYQRYAAYRSWKFKLLESESVPINFEGLRKAVIEIQGFGALSSMRFESGVHCCRRIPPPGPRGESQLMYTGTVHVTVVPKPSETATEIDAKDLQIKLVQTSGGPGGMNRDHSYKKVIIKHLPSGIEVSNDTNRSTEQNKSLALKELKRRLQHRSIDEYSSEIRRHRKDQVGAKSLSEKIRMYHYQQGVVIDHRLTGFQFTLSDLMSGRQKYDSLIQQLQRQHREEALLEVVKSAISN